MASSNGRIKVVCRLRPLLASETDHAAAPWRVEDTAIGLQGFEGRRTTKGDAELRNLDHLKRDVAMVCMDRVFGGQNSTKDTFEELRHVVAGLPQGLNGAILAYGQTSSGKTYSMLGPDLQAMHRALLDKEDTKDFGVALWPDSDDRKGIVHFAVDEAFRLLAEQKGDGGMDFLVRVSYLELYMERANDLLREMSPASTNLPVKEDPERGFYVEGVKEKIVQAPEQVLSAVWKAERRRRIAHTRYNEVSSRSHTLLTLTVESCSKASGSEDDDVQSTRVGCLTLVDLAGCERLSEDTRYKEESSSINKSLFFLGEVISKLSQLPQSRDVDPAGTMRSLPKVEDLGDAARATGGALHIPYRDSKLTRLLQHNLGGNSSTAMLITLHPAVAFVDQSLQTLRFAAKAASVRTVLRPNYVSKEQSLIARQKELIMDLRQQIKAYEQTKPPAAAPAPELQSQKKALASIEGLSVGAAPPPRVEYVSQSRELDVIVLTLHKSNEQLQQRAKAREAALQQLKDQLRAAAGQMREELAAWAEEPGAAPRLPPVGAGLCEELGAVRAAWEEALSTASSAVAQAQPAVPTPPPSDAGALRAENARLKEELRKALASGTAGDAALRRENVQLKKHAKEIAAERSRLAQEVQQLQRAREEEELRAADELERCRADVMKEIATLQRERSNLAGVVPRSPSGDSDFDLASALNTATHGADPDVLVGGATSDLASALNSAAPDTFASALGAATGAKGVGGPPRFDGPSRADARTASTEGRGYRGSTASTERGHSPRSASARSASARSQRLSDVPPRPGASALSGRGTPRSGLGGTPRAGTPRAGGTPPTSALSSVTLDFYRQRRVKVDWQPGDRCRRLKDGKVMTVVRMCADAYPPYVMLRGADGVETAAELPLIAPLDQPAAAFPPAALTPRSLAAATLRAVAPPAVAPPFDAFGGDGPALVSESGRTLPVRSRRPADLPRPAAGSPAEAVRGGPDQGVLLPDAPAPQYLRPAPPAAAAGYR